MVDVYRVNGTRTNLPDRRTESTGCLSNGSKGQDSVRWLEGRVSVGNQREEAEGGDWDEKGGGPWGF